MPLNLQDDPRDCCNYCSKAAGKASLRKCSACKMVRHCSQECQRAAWKNHKASCKLNETLLANLSLNPASENLNNQLTRWLTVWKPFIYQIGPIAFDLANHPSNRLSTHCVLIEIEKRPKSPSPAQFFRMIGGGVITKAQWAQKMREMDCDESAVEDWSTDNRGDDTVCVVVLCEEKRDGLVRMLYSSLRDGGASYRRIAKDKSSTLAQGWVEGFMAAVEEGKYDRL